MDNIRHVGINEPDPVQLPEEEERQEGTVGWRVYYEWLRNGCGPFKFFILLLLNLLTQGLYVMSDWWLALWLKIDRR